jgi:hypothetical protein
VAESKATNVTEATMRMSTTSFVVGVITPNISHRSSGFWSRHGSRASKSQDITTL